MLLFYVYVYFYVYTYSFVLDRKFEWVWLKHKSPRRSSFGNDRAECDRMCGRLTNYHLRWLELTLSHSLWSEIECFSVSWTCIYHRREASQEKDESNHRLAAKISAIRFVSSSIWIDRYECYRKSKQVQTALSFVSDNAEFCFKVLLVLYIFWADWFFILMFYKAIKY